MRRGIEILVQEQKPERVSELEDILLLVIMFFTLITWVVAVTRLLFWPAA